ncbi:type I polyketide synthase [Tsukamurella ocularis]|uniref:type I polyketide synthase n=1 Tax=Tsukamurella ocularis TaxID=1970234 RepID=UPI002166FCCB|nr:type I polyketide synthase [Tsukamurella ocularis]MCS3780477.1 hybrid polyketide synthase/nonribosomal peptide synthetase FtdB [Tsukamurella ocularis]MCS3785968.1 hybrid polyketide synthase/nonribosomal peptide synthetase FtdB [Tsukamurella ocularis]MCS3849332.1 hybrid polyketide synthase/nonribosomal peptide synthetase FtdB [Tsukamurella ocularis]
MRNEVSETRVCGEPAHREPIAVVGIGCRLPGGVRSAEDFWKLLDEERDAIVDIPAGRWSTDRYYESERTPGKSRVRRGGFLTDPVDEFDPAFFGISPIEASSMDPQQRLLLEVAWESIEDAGLRAEELERSQTAVFTGGFTLDYSQMQFSTSAAEPPTVAAHTATGVVMTMLSNRISHAFDLLGPSMSVDTACSSSLVAIHLACQSIWNGESDLALAGGVNLMLSPNFTVAASTGGFLSPTSTSRAFDAAANGYVRGEGAALVVLKPLAQARADGDRVYATVLGTAVSQDGRTNGITVPNGDSQKRAIEAALARAGIAADSVDYVEAHGTGTPVGDPIEATAIGEIYGAGRPADRPLVIGSVKTNLGHLEAAAGVVGFIKSALALAHRRVPRHLHLDTLNPAIDLDKLRIRVATESTPLRPDGPLRAGVNSFGFGGTNAHAILESVPVETRAPVVPADGVRDGVAVVLPLAARSENALAHLAAAYVGVAAAEGSAPLAGALAHRRSAHRAARLAVIAADATEAEDALRTAAAGVPHQAVRMGSALAGARPLAFVYTGMGPQWWGMARGLLQNNSVFRAAIERCDAAITPLAGWSLTAELLAPESASRMQESVVAQIANFGVQCALTRLWESFGVRPDLIVGHSAGEVAAALEAGAMTFDDAITVIVHRARLQHTASGGGRLLAVALGEAAARDLPEVARGEVEFAAINSPESVALVGALPVLESLAERLGADGVFARLVPGDVPYHSRAMDPLEAELRTVLAGLAPGAPSIPLYSTVTGARVPMDGSAPHDAEYWWRNIRRPVLFGAAAGAMIDGGAGSGASGPNHPGAVTFLEIGPTAVVGRAIAEVAAARGQSATTVASLRRDGEDAESFAAALAELWVRGVDVDFSPLVPRAPMRSLPAYPWQTGRYWSEGDAGRRERLADTVEPYLGNRSDGALPGWRRLLDGTAPRSLADHVVHGATLFPGAGFLEIAAEVARDEYGATACTLQGVAFETALMHGGGTYLVDTSLDADSGRIAIHGKVPGAGRWARHATATLRPAPSIAPHAEVAPVAGTRIDEDALYERFRDAGFAYGPAYRLLYDVTVGDGAASARIRAVAAEPVADRAPILEPSVLDAAFQLLLPLAFQRAEGAKLMPVGVDRVVIHARPEGPVVARATARTSPDPATISGDVILAGDDGRVLAEVEGFTVRILGDAAAAPQRVGTEWVYEEAWEPQPADDAERTSAEGTWLLLADRTDVADRLADRLTAAGGTPVLLHAGAADGAVPPADRAALAAALDRAVPDAGLRGIVHLWSLDASPDAADPLRWTAHEAVLSVMHLAAELEQRGVAAPTFLVTDGAQPVAGGVSAAGLLQSTMLGVGRVLHHELSGLQARLVDLDPGDREGSAAMLFDELTVTGSDEDQVAFRDGTRLVARLYPSARSGGRIPARMRPDGAYLVTGGLGALGRLVLVALAERGAGHLIVTSRSGLPARATWDDLTDPAQRDAVVAVRTAEAAGATVHVVAVDVTDAAALAACLERLRSGGVPALRGVIHSAGAVDDQILVRMTQEQVERVVRPKVLGAWALHEATAGEPLDFFALFSSISAVIPSPGQGNYAAGNAFLDALAHYRRAQGLPALSINWGPWDAGMIASLGLRELYGQRGIDLIDPVTGMDLLAELLGSGEVQQGVVSAHWPTVIESYALTPTLVAHLGRAEGDEEGDAESILERLGSAAADDRAPIAADGVRLTVSRVLRMAEEHIPDDEPLGRLGVDSMLATELRIRVEQQFRAAPSIAFLLDGATVATIAAELLATLDFSSGDIEPDAEVDDLASLLADLDDEAVAALLAQSETTEPNAGGPR